MKDECTCTQDLGYCQHCIDLELTGYMFIKDNGEKGVGLLWEECDQLRMKETQVPPAADIKFFLKYVDSCVLFFVVHEGNESADTKIQAVRDWLGELAHDETEANADKLPNST